MAISKNAVAGGVAALGGTGAVAGVVIANQNKETIGKKLKDYLLSTADTFNTEWEVKVNELSGITDQKQLEHGLKSVKENTDKRKSLKDWCENQKEETVTDELETLVRKWCVFTIKEKIGNKSLRTETTGTTTDEGAWKHKSQTLKDVNDEADPKITEDLKTIKDEITDIEQHWTKLANWCKATYEKGFKGTDSIIYKLANKFCSKPTIQEVLRGDELGQNNFETEWGKLAEKSKDSAKNEELKKITTSSSSSTMKTWCQTQYSKDFDSKAKEGTADLLLTDVRGWCVYTIKDKISETENKVLTTTSTGSESDFKSLVKTLNTYAGTDPSLTDDLKGIKQKKSSDTDDSKWSELRDWCNTTYSKSYKGSNDNLWKLADKFCKKS